MIIVKAGQIEQWIGQDHAILEVGDSVYLDADVVHASFNVGSETAHLQVVLAPVLGRRGLPARGRGLGAALGVPAQLAPTIAETAPHRSSRLRRGRAREHDGGVRRRDPPRRRRDRGGRAAPQRRRARGAPRSRRRSRRAAARGRPGTRRLVRRRPQSGPQGERHRTPAGRARARRRADRPCHVHGRQLGDARGNPPSGAGYPRRPDDAAPHGRRSGCSSCSGCGTPGAPRRCWPATTRSSSRATAGW